MARRPIVPRLESRRPFDVKAVGATRREDVGSRAQVVDEGQLQRGWPRPELTHRQRRDRLECRDESVQPLRVEATRTAPNQLERHRIDAGEAGELVGHDPGQPAEKCGWQIVMNVPKRGEHDVKVVEQPLGGRRRRLPAFCVVGQRCVDLSKRSGVFAEALQVGAAAAA